MSIEITKEWCLKMAQLETNTEISAGLLAFDPIFDDAQMTESKNLEETNIAFGRLRQGREPIDCLPLEHNFK